MKRVLLLIVSIILMSGPAYARLHKEAYYQTNWCALNKGIREVTLYDNTRVDCITKDYAVEFDFADKWAESIGQSLYYALVTGKKPAVGLIIESNKDYKYLRRLKAVADKYNITVFVLE